MVFRLLCFLMLASSCLVAQRPLGIRIAAGGNFLKIKDVNFTFPGYTHHSSILAGGSIGIVKTFEWKAFDLQATAFAERGGYAYRTRPLLDDKLPVVRRTMALYSAGLGALAQQGIVNTRSGRRALDAQLGLTLRTNVVSRWTPDPGTSVSNSDNIRLLDLSITGGLRYHFPPRKSGRLSLDLRYHHGITDLSGFRYSKTYRRSMEMGVMWEWYKEKKTGKKRR